MRTPREDVVVTGVGAVSPLGVGVASLRAHVTQGSAVAASVEPPGPGGFLAVRDLDPKAFIAPMVLRRLDRGSTLGVCAALLAARDAGLDPSRAPERTAVLVGAGGTGIEATSRFYRVIVEQGGAAANPSIFPNTVPNAPAGQIAIALGASGPSATFAAQGTAAEDALDHAADLVASGRADAAIAGGIDEGSEALVHGYRRLRALSPRGVARPFDARRDGMVLAESAAFFVLERESSARARGARIRARILSRASGGVLAPPGGRMASDHSLARVVRRALAEAGIDIAALGWVSSLANGSRGADLLEARSLAALAGGRAAPLPVASSRAVTGGGMAAGALSVALAIVALEEGRVLPTAGLESLDAEIARAALGRLTLAAWGGASRGPVLHTAGAEGGSVAALVLSDA